MSTSEIIGAALKIVALLLGYLFEKNVEKKAQKAETIKAVEANLKEITEAINNADESAFTAALGRLNRNRR